MEGGLQLSHFTAAVIFAIFASVVFGITQKENPREMTLYGLKCFGLFTVLTVLASWAMWLIKR